MTIDAEIVQTLDKMPDSLKYELLHYANYLIANYLPAPNEAKASVQKRRSGILEGTFVLPLPADFDEPLEDFQDDGE